MPSEIPAHKLVRVLVLSIFPDSLSSDSQEIQTAIARAQKGLHVSLAKDRVAYEALVAGEVSVHPKSARLAELIRVLPKTDRNLKLLYLLTQLKNSPYRKKRRWDSASKPVAEPPKVPSADFNPNFIQILAEIKAFALGKSLPNPTFLTVDPQNRLVLKHEDQFFPSVARELIFRANLFAFHHRKISDFLAASSSSPYTNLIKDYIRLCPNAEAFDRLESSSAVCVLSFLENTFRQLETGSYLIHQLSFCDSEEMILNCLLRNYYIPRDTFTQQALGTILAQISPVFCRHLVDFATRDIPFLYYRVLGKSPKHLFHDIEIFDKNLPYRVISPDFLRKMVKIKTLVQLLQTEFLVDAQWSLKDLAPQSISLIDENSLLVFQNEVEKVYNRLQEKLSDFLTEGQVLVREVEIFRLTILGGWSRLTEDLIREYNQLTRYHHNRMKLESAFETAYWRLPPSFQPYYQYFTVIFYEPLGKQEPVATNLFVRYEFSQIPRVVASAYFQENNMKVFNFLLKVREFSMEWQAFAWENRRMYNRTLHQLVYSIRLFFRNLLAHFSYQVIDSLCRDLQSRLAKASRADQILDHVNNFSDQLIDYLFLNAKSPAQRAIYLLLDILVSRLRRFMAIPKASPNQSIAELKAYRKIHAEITLKLAELEAQKPRGVYYSLRFQLEFNGFGDIRHKY